MSTMRQVQSSARRHPFLAVFWLAVLVVALVQLARASVFAWDVTRVDYSASPSSRFVSQHCCLTAYSEAARFALQGDIDIYDASNYRPGGEYRRIGPLTVDPYHYPPPFLLLPGAVRAVAPDFFETRFVWFVFQVVVLAVAVFGTAMWIGGAEGARVGLTAIGFWALPTTYMALQSGNFQVTAVAIAMLGMLLASGRHVPAGGSLLAFAATGKLFPSMLVLHVVATRRWRTVGAIAVATLALIGLTAAVFGLNPFVQFLQGQVPALASGAAFPQIEDPSSFAANTSIYGLTTKLRGLGLAWFDPAVGRLVSRLYFVFLAGLAVASGWRGRDLPAIGRPRLERAAAWLGILNLASFASPFVGGLYGWVGTTWLLSLLAAGATSPWRRWLCLAAMAATACVQWVTPTPRTYPVVPSGLLALTAAWQIGALVVNTWAAWPRAGARGVSP